ncbi:MAG: hypothetical protein RL684_846 [Pseudomonadota bacterium]|jgi:sterol desaturase/sphingolipid hydroxylase (fatty acid hydroxylase superfamily)
MQLATQLAQQTPALLWLAAMALFTLAELALRRAVSWRRRAVNVAAGAIVMLTILLTVPAVGAARAALYGSLGLVFNPPFLLDLYMPPALAALTFLLVYDLGYYWFHRWQHASPLLWRVHAVHHSETDLNATSYARQHFLENVLQSFALMVPLLLLVTLTPTTFAWVAIISTFVQFFAHAALPIHFGPLSKLLISPRLHRVHHSSDRVESDSNYASMFPVWDVIFGTYRPPAPQARTGLHSGAAMLGLWSLVASPFTRRRW